MPKSRTYRLPVFVLVVGGGPLLSDGLAVGLVAVDALLEDRLALRGALHHALDHRRNRILLAGEGRTK